MGLGKKQGLLISKAWMPAVQNLTGQSHPVPYTGRSKNSAKIIQDLYDGVYIGMPAGKPEVSNSDYLAIEALYGKKEGKAKRGIFQIIVLRHMDYFKNETNKAVRKIGVEKIFDDSYVNSPIYLFNPSRHMIRDIKDDPFSQAMDIKRTNKGTEERDTAHAVYTDYSRGKHKGRGHYHLGY